MKLSSILGFGFLFEALNFLNFVSVDTFSSNLRFLDLSELTSLSLESFVTGVFASEDSESIFPSIELSSTSTSFCFSIVRESSTSKSFVL